MRRIERIVYKEHARLIIWRRSVRISCGHHYSVWDGCGTISKRTVTGVCWGQELESQLGARKSSYVERPIRLGSDGSSHPTQYDTWSYCFMGANIITALRRSLPASQACQPASFELCFRIHVTSHIKHHDSANVRAFIPHQYQQHTPISPQPLFINHQSINWSMEHIWINGNHGSGSGMTRTLFFIVFVGNCYEFGICSPYAKPGVD